MLDTGQSRCTLRICVSACPVVDCVDLKESTKKEKKQKQRERKGETDRAGDTNNIARAAQKGAWLPRTVPTKNVVRLTT